MCCGDGQNEKGNINIDVVSLAKTPDGRSPKSKTVKPSVKNIGDSDSTLRKEVDEIWEKYDKNKNGLLDKDEAHKFLAACMKEVTGEVAAKEDIERNF